MLWHLLTDYGPNGGEMVRCGSVGMVYRALNVTHESLLEKQPLISRFGQILAWDGRLDNRDDLIPGLRDDLHNEVAQVTDPAIVMAAYLRWGIEFPSRLIGDFALVLWDPYPRTLLLARDPFGVRTLFYHANESRIIWSSILRELLEVAGAELKVDDEYIAGFLTRYPEPWQTPYKGFQAVSPGNVVIIRDGQLKERRYWSPDPQAEIQYRTTGQYEERFRQLLGEAVRCRLRAHGPVFAELSGGLDSSSIVCMADQILERGDAETPRVETVSYVYDEARTSDERPFIRSVEEKRGKLGYHIREDDYRLLTISAEETFVSAPSYHYYYVERYKALREAMGRNGARVLLSGEGGDQLNIANPDPDIALADHIFECRPLPLHRCLRDWSYALKKPYLQLLWTGVALLLPRSVQARCRPIAQVPPWLEDGFVARMNLRERMLGPSDIYGYRLPSRRDQAEGLLSVVRTVSAIYSQEYARIEYSYPYLHRPLVEFLLAVPIEQKISPGEGRSLVRRSMSGVLPERIVKRKGKKGPTDALSRAVAREWPRLRPMLVDPRVCEYGYVSPEALMTAVDQVRHGTQKFTFHLFVTISTEFWLRSLERRLSGARSAAGSAAQPLRTEAAHLGAGSVPAPLGTRWQGEQLRPPT